MAIPVPKLKHLPKALPAEDLVRIELVEGDSAKEIAKYWGNASIEEIHDRVTQWKAKRR